MADQSQQQRKRIARVAPSGVEDAVRQGRKVIFVDGDPGTVPYGYTLVPMRYKRADGKEEQTKVILPKQLLWYVANKGGGDTDQALDDLADAYGDVGDQEDRLMVDGAVPGASHADLAVSVKRGYATYLINKLTHDGKGFDEETTRELGLDDPEVENRLQAIAAIRLGKPIEEVRKHGLEGLLFHVERTAPKTVLGAPQPLNRSEIKDKCTFRYANDLIATKTTACLHDSHYDLKPEYIDDPNWDYDLKSRTKRPKVLVPGDEILVADDTKKVQVLFDEIATHRTGKGRTPGRHDEALLRQYVNLAYIAKENPAAQLDVIPAEQKANTIHGDKQ